MPAAAKMSLLLRAEAERIRLMERCRLGGDGEGKAMMAKQRGKGKKKKKKKQKTQGGEGGGVFKNGARRDDRANNEGVAWRCEANRWEQPISHLTGGDSGDFWDERQDRAN